MENVIKTSIDFFLLFQCLRFSLCYGYLPKHLEIEQITQGLVSIRILICTSMSTLMEYSSAQPRECSFLPKRLMSTNNFLLYLFWVVHDMTKIGPSFRK